jgi:hypothetical protein
MKNSSLPRAKKSDIPKMPNILEPRPQISGRNFLKINDRLIDLDLIEYCDIEESGKYLNGKVADIKYILELKLPRAKLDLKYIFDTIEEAREIIDFIAEQAQIKSFDLKPEQVCQA